MIVTQSGYAAPSGYTKYHPIIGWENKLTVSNIVATAENADYPVTNVVNPATHLYWKGTSTATQYLTHTPSDSDLYDYCGIAGHNLGSGGWTVSIEGYTSPSWATIAGTAAPTDDLPLLFRWTAASYIGGLRIKLTGGTVIPRIASVFFGKLLIMERKVLAPHTPITMGREIKAVTPRSQAGNFLGSIVTRESRSADISFEHLTDSWYRANMDEFVDYAALRNPFFFAWLPDTFANDVGYGWCVNDPRPTIQNANGNMKISLDVDAIA